MNHNEARSFLIASLTKRFRPEDTVEAIRALLGESLSLSDRMALIAAMPRWRSRMGDDYAQAAPLTARTERLAQLRALAETAPMRTRLANRIARLERAYVHEKREQEAQARFLWLTQFAETGFASVVGPLLTDDNSIAFIAWMTARLGMRSEFTNGPQKKAFDTIAQRLLLRCNETADWPEIARVFPRADILVRLNRDALLALLDSASELLQEISGLLERTANKSNLNLSTMIVRQGNDSSTWNALAGAWNKARDYWLAALSALDWLWVLDECCPGKVLRLMAADVAAWHRYTDGDSRNKNDDSALHPDTRIWRDLPAPWLVLDGRAKSRRVDVENICKQHGVDPVKSGWAGARARTTVEEFTVTPELVYGVTVNHPTLALFLRKAGVFSGKELRPEKLGAGFAKAR